MGIDGRDSQVGINETLVSRKCQIPHVKTSARRNRRKMVPNLGESKGRHVHFPKGWRPHSIKKNAFRLASINAKVASPNRQTAQPYSTLSGTLKVQQTIQKHLFL